MTIAIPETWTFESAAVAGGFDAHVREQLPWYDIATFGVVHLGSHYLPTGGRAYDIGAANGNIARAFDAVIANRGIDFVSIEAAREMAKTWKAPGRLIVADACDVPLEGADLIVSFLTLIFITPAKRRALIERIKASLRPGGAFIAVERMAPEAGYPALGMTRMTLAHKLAAGAQPAAILEKELSLVGIQRPMPREAFDGCREWFRMGHFSGWLYESGE